MAKPIKKKAPSRARYEQSHPTVSCRVSREIYDRLQTVKEADSKSFANILKVGLGLLEVEVEEKEKIKRKGHAEGYRKGYTEAERLYKVTYPCDVCGEMLTVTAKNEKSAIKEYMQEHGWGHTECH